ncbi:MAG: SurA N-terminal domain-containing protein [Treponema sp.]|nr:SurA N-terminal domain-containing protein [Treponema sp.]
MAKKDKKLPAEEKISATEEIYKKFKQRPGLYIGSVVILILVVIAFVGGDFIAGGGLDRRNRDLTFGYYDNVPITLIPGNYFSENLQNMERMFRAQGVDVNDFIISAQIWRRAFEGTVTHTAILEMMRKSNYDVPKNKVDREVARLPFFQEDGRFSRTLYHQYPESTRNSIWRQEYEKLIKLMFFSDYSGLLKSEGEALFIANMSSPLRSFEMVAFKVDNFPESEYLSYAQNNSSLFNSIHMSRITLGSNEREARRVLSSVKDGITTFEDAAKNHSQDMYKENGGDMGRRFFYELDREIINPSDREAIFKLRNGEISDIVMTVDGWAFFRVENETIQANFNDEIVMDRVRTFIRNFERGKMEDWAIEQANEFISDAKENGFDNAARWRNMDRHAFGPLPVNYGGTELFTSLDSFSMTGFSSQELNTLARNENFWKIAFSAPVNTPSHWLVQGNNVIVLFPVEETTADELSIENTASMFTSWWLSYISEQLMQQFFINSSKFDDIFWEVYFPSN